MTQAPTNSQACDSQAGPMCTQLEVAPIESLNSMDWPNLVRRFVVGVEWFDPRLFHLPEDNLGTPFKPESGAGQFPIRALVTHLADCDMVLLHRICRAVSEETPLLGLFDHDAFIDGLLYGRGTRSGVTTAPPVAGSVAVLHTLRRWALDWLFDMDEATQNCSAMHPEKGAITVRKILTYATWHLEHHAKFLNAKIQHLLGPMPEAPPMPKGGCGPSCGCASKQTGGAMPRAKALILGFLMLALAGCQEVVLNELPKNDLFGRLGGAPGSRAGRASANPSRGLDPALQTPIRKELPDGEIILRSRTARNLMAHIQRALIAREQELERKLFAEYLLSNMTRAEYEGRGLDPDQAYQTLVAHRDDVLLLFNRIGPLAQNSPQVIMQLLSNNVIRLQVTGLAKDGLRWTFMDMVMEDSNWRLRWFG